MWTRHDGGNTGISVVHDRGVERHVAEERNGEIVRDGAAGTAAELVPSLTASIEKARKVLGGFDDSRMTAMWRLQSGGKDILAMPRVAVVRAIMLNHWYHHRGQLLVYLRLLNQSVPSVYGPTADENPFAIVAPAASV